MPCLTIHTNVPQREIPADFVDKIIPVLSKCVGMETHKFICTISGDCQVSFGGESHIPGAVATLESIGKLNETQNRIIIKDISDFLEEEINVKSDRFFISLYDLKSHMIGRFGDTVVKLVEEANELDK